MPRKRKQASGSKLTGSKQAKRLASAVLEVLSGLRSPPEASRAVGISLQRYYQLETRAVQGLLSALEPLPKGGRRKPQNELAKVKAERDRLERELRRAQALVRVAQRTVGLPSPEAQRKAEAKKGTKKRRRQPVLRARNAIAKLKADLGEGPEQESSDQAKSA